MRKSLSVFVLFFIVASEAFAVDAVCRFKESKLEGVESLTLETGLFIINNNVEIPLVESSIHCGQMGLKQRLDGLAEGYQIVLKSCSFDGSFEGHVTDTARRVSSDVICDSGAE